MGRAFEFRKERKFKRWGNMARVFTKLGKEITIAVKQAGPLPENNPRLRLLMQTARKEKSHKESNRQRLHRLQRGELRRIRSSRHSNICRDCH